MQKLSNKRIMEAIRKLRQNDFSNDEILALFNLSLEDINKVFEKIKASLLDKFPNRLVIDFDKGPETTEEFIKAIEDKKGEVKDWARDVMKQPDFKNSKETGKCDIVFVTRSDLGLPETATLGEVEKVGRKFGLQKAPTQTGLKLCLLDINNYEKEKWYIIIIDPIKYSIGDSGIFYVGRDDDGLALGADYHNPDDVYPSGAVFAFALRK